MEERTVQDEYFTQSGTTRPKSMKIAPSARVRPSKQQEQEPNEDEFEDVVGFKKKPKEEDNSPSSKCRSLYKKICKRFDIVPESRFARQIGNDFITMRDYGLGSSGIKALCATLKHDKECKSLDLSGNCVGPKEIRYISEIFKTNKQLSELALSNNHLSGNGVKMVAKLIRNNQTITSLHLSGNHISDADSESLVSLLCDKNNCLKRLNLGHNELRESAGKVIGKALAHNDTLEDLDLSWNHLRGKGAEGLALGLVKNRNLTRLNLAWNGFSHEGCVAMAHALQHNMTLTELDLSSNRIHPPAAVELWTGGVLKNKTLTRIRLGRNPISPIAATAMLAKLKDNLESSLQFLDLSHIVVTKEFEVLLDELHDTRMFVCIYELAMPVHWDKWREDVERRKREQMFGKSTVNIDPVRVLFFMKKKLRCLDLFKRIDGDSSHSLSRDEIVSALKKEDFELSASAIDALMDFMDTDGDGKIDLLEFIDGERRMKREAIARRQKMEEENQSDISKSVSSIRQDPGGLQTRYSTTFRANNKADPLLQGDMDMLTTLTNLVTPRDATSRSTTPRL